MDDATNNQRLDMHAQKDMNTKVLNDQTNNVANNQDEKIGNNQSISVANDQSIKVDNDQSTSVNNNRSIDVKGNQALSVKGNRSVVVVSGNNSLDVSAGNSVEEVKQTKSTHAKIIQSEGDEQIALKVGGATIVIDKKSITLQFEASTIQLNSGGVFVQGKEIHLNK
jgi:type VI secretion system vgr family protein